MAKERKKSDKRAPVGAKERKSGKRPSGTRKPGRDASDGPGGFVPDDRPAVTVTVDVVLLAMDEGELSVLLVERRRDPQRKAWALPGTVVEPDEELVTAAARAVAGRTGVAVAPGRLAQLATFADPGRDPRTRVMTVGFLAVAERATPPAGGKVASGRWWRVSEVMAKKGPTLAFDHAAILSAALASVDAGLESSDLGIGLVEEPFTLGDLRRAYEAVWGVPLEPANFRRKVLATPGFVEATGQVRMVTTGRPAELYRRGTGGRLHPPLLRPR